jgi:hypothetical protein
MLKMLNQSNITLKLHIHQRVHHSIQKDHIIGNILGSLRKVVLTRSRLTTFCEFHSFVSSLEPIRFEEALLDDPNWVLAIQEELKNFTRNEVYGP